MRPAPVFRAYWSGRLAGAASVPMPSAQASAIRNESVGTEAAPTARGPQPSQPIGQAMRASTDSVGLARLSV
ncbi:DUF6053 domain-containing protein [Lysobacter enzymogenes]|uniref:DUF6053 domain-containing protein n=1 Tax=Lysobacter enzymogenes TaxID=69 RepID=UPI003D189726